MIWFFCVVGMGAVLYGGLLFFTHQANHRLKMRPHVWHKEQPHD
jgi:hypothetical protein